MSGMWSFGRERDWRIHSSFTVGHSVCNETNEDADAIIASPDRYLLNKDKLFEAEGGWGTCALTLGLGLVGVAGVLTMNSRIGTHLGRGSLRATEWA